MHLSALLATAQLEMFRSIKHWIHFARSKIADRSTTKHLEMTQRTEELIRLIMAADESALDYP